MIGQTLRKLPAVAKSILLPTALLWIAASLMEASTYLLLAFSIVHQFSPWPVLLTAILTVTITVYAARSGYWAGAQLAENLYQHLRETLLNIRPRSLTEKPRSTATQLATGGIPGLMSIPAHQLQVFLHAPLLPIFLSIGAIGIVGMPLGLTLTLSLVISFAWQWRAQKALADSEKQRLASESATTLSTHELANNTEWLRGAAGFTEATHRIELAWMAQSGALANSIRAIARASLESTLANLLPLASISVVLLLINETSTTVILAALMLTMRATSPLENITIAAIGFNNQRKTLRDYQALEDLPSIPLGHSEQTADPSVNIQPNDAKLTLVDIKLGPQQQPVCLNLPKNHRLVIRGASGSGKTTLFHQLLGFEPLQEGAILLDNRPLQSFSRIDLARQLSYVNQHPILFNGTIASNIRLGNPDASDDEITTLCGHLQLGELIARNPKGIHQPIMDNGAQLSGGEAQRINIARAVVKQAPLLLLDEPTSSLDADTENAVVNLILQQRITLLVITHRHSALWQPDQTLTLTE